MIEAFKHVRSERPLINYPNFTVTTKFKRPELGTYGASADSAHQLTP